ncbi:MAG: class I SAM-dependent methyltransferase [Fibrobacterales bacterium]
MDYHTKSGITEYIALAKGYDGTEIIEALCHHIPETAQVLELGMGPGVDFKILSQYNPTTGSDNSKAFIERYQQIDPYADLIVLDAVAMNTSRIFDALYSNKVLHHLKQHELMKSFDNQSKVLNSGGVICHSFWKGSHDEHMHGLYFNYHTPEEIEELLSNKYRILEVTAFSEMDDNDSFFIIAQKK